MKQQNIINQMKLIIKTNNDYIEQVKKKEEQIIKEKKQKEE